MADWIKVRHALVRSAKMRRMARALNCKSQLTMLGLAVKWLCWIDEQTEDGKTHLLPDELDEEMGWRGCAHALISIGWADLDEQGRVVAVDFDKHSGETAKKRAENARRQAEFKERKRRGNADALPNALPEENRREENNNTCSTLSPNERGSTRGELQAEGEREGVPTLDEIINVMQSIRYGNMTDKDIRLCAEQWLDTMQSTGWLDARGNPIQKWAPSARVWVRSWATNRAKATRAGGAYKAPKNLNDASEYGTH